MLINKHISMLLFFSFMLPWSIKYRPSHLSSLVGQDALVAKVREFLDTFPSGKKRALLLVGPPGCGKTTIATAAAKERKMELVEVNASDQRNKKAITATVAQSMAQQSLFFSSKIVLLDEVDGLSGKDDRGGAATLAPLVQKSTFPIIMTANDPDSARLKPLKKVATVLVCPPLSADSMQAILEHICKEEKVEYEADALLRLARKNMGDLRATINDLETLSTFGKITADTISSLSDRLRSKPVEDVLRLIFKTKNMSSIFEGFDAVGMSMDEFLMWVDENLPKEYAFADLDRAYEALARADVFFGRIRRRQHWRFLVYIKSFLTAHVALAKEQKMSGAISYSRSRRPLKIWMMNNKLAKKKALAEKIAPLLHVSKKVARQEMNVLMPTLKSFSDAVFEKYNFSDDEVAWIRAQ